MSNTWFLIVLNDIAKCGKLITTREEPVYNIICHMYAWKDYRMLINLLYFYCVRFHFVLSLCVQVLYM